MDRRVGYPCYQSLILWSSSSATFRLEAQLQALSFSSEQGKTFISKSLASHGDMFEKSFMRLVEAQHEYEHRLAEVESFVSTLPEKSAKLEHNSTSTNQQVPHWRYRDSSRSFLLYEQLQCPTYALSAAINM